MTRGLVVIVNKSNLMADGTQLHKQWMLKLLKEEFDILDRQWFYLFTSEKSLKIGWEYFISRPAMGGNGECEQSG
jgi:hypothetical protein